MRQELICAHKWGSKIETAETKTVDGKVEVTPLHIRVCKHCEEWWNLAEPEPRIVLGLIETV